MALDISERVSKREARETRAADLDRRDTEHGGMVSIPELVADQVKRETLRDWRAYRPSVKLAEVRAARRGDTVTDPRRITIGRLYVDCGAAVRRFARAYRRDAAETLRNDALLLLVRWPHHGDARRIDLGGADGLPLRCDWLERGKDGRERLTALAWRALHAAVKQAAESPAARAELEQSSAEVPTDPVDISALVELEQRETDAPTRLPDSAAPEVIAHYLDLPLDAARAIVARAYPAASPKDLAEAWRMSEGALKVALSRGAARVREMYPDPLDLLAALDSLAAQYRADVAADAALALLKLRDGRSEVYGPASPVEARAAALEWRSLTGELSPERRALLVAALRATRDGDRAERIAASVSRIMRAEARRGRRLAEAGSRGGAPLRACEVSPAASEARSSAALQLARADRVWTYGLEARTDRAAR